MAVVVGCKGLDKDGIGIKVVGNHDVLVSAVGTDRESAGVVDEQFVEWQVQEVE